MNYGEALGSGLDELRGYATERHLCRLEVRRLTGRKTQNAGTGREVPTYVVVHTNVPCRLPSAVRATGADDAGRAARPEIDREVCVSPDLPLLEFGWFVVITAVDPRTNPGHIGQAFMVTDPGAADQIIERHIGVTGEGVPMEMVPDAG